MATKSSSVVSDKTPKASTPAGAKKTTGAGGYSETTTKNSDGSVTSTANKPQDGSSGTVKNSDGSSTVYNGKGGYSTYDASGNRTGSGLNGTESWKDGSSGNTSDLSPAARAAMGGSGGSAKNQSISALSGDMGALGYFNNEQDLYNRLLSPTEALGLTPEQRQEKYNEYLLTAHAQLNPIRDNYNSYLNVLKGQQETDNLNLDRAYNQNANDMFSNQFHQAGQMQQQMSDRGLSGSGLSADALARMQMSGNSDLNRAFIEAQGQKADINKQYNQMNYDINTRLAELSPEAMAAKNIDGYGTEYLDKQTAAQANQQKTMLEMYNTLLGNNTSRMNNVNDNSAKVQMNELDNYTTLTGKGMDNQAMLDGKNIDGQYMLTGKGMDNQNNLDVENLRSFTTLTKAEMDNKYNAAVEAGKLQLAQDIQNTDATGTVYIGGKQLLVKGNPIPTMDFMRLTEEQRHNIATENNVANGQYLDFEAAMDSNNASRENSQRTYEVGMDSNEVKRQQIAADIGIASKNIELGYAKLEKDYFVAQGNIDQAAAKMGAAARTAGNSEAESRIATVKAKIDAVKSQIKNGKPTDVQAAKLEGFLNELDEIGKSIGTTFEETASSSSFEGLIP